MDLQKGWGEPRPLEPQDIKDAIEYLKIPRPPTRSCCGSVFPNHLDYCLVGKIEREELECQQ